jgi:hypothetical protein
MGEARQYGEQAVTTLHPEVAEQLLKAMLAEWVAVVWQRLPLRIEKELDKVQRTVLLIRSTPFAAGRRFPAGRIILPAHLQVLLGPALALQLSRGRLRTCIVPGFVYKSLCEAER